MYLDFLPNSAPVTKYDKRAGHGPFRCVIKNKLYVQDNTSMLGSLAQITVLCLISTAPGINALIQISRL